ncbi:unnamed protein product [Merluccius merluccius]
MSPRLSAPQIIRKKANADVTYRRRAVLQGATDRQHQPSCRDVTSTACATRTPTPEVKRVYDTVARTPAGSHAASISPAPGEKQAIGSSGHKRA